MVASPLPPTERHTKRSCERSSSNATRVTANTSARSPPDTRSRWKMRVSRSMYAPASSVLSRRSARRSHTRSCSGHSRAGGRLRRPVPSAARIRSSHRTRRRWGSSRPPPTRVCTTRSCPWSPRSLRRCRRHSPPPPRSRRRSRSRPRSSPPPWRRGPSRSNRRPGRPCRRSPRHSGANAPRWSSSGAIPASASGSSSPANNSKREALRGARRCCRASSAPACSRAT